MPIPEQKTVLSNEVKTKLKSMILWMVHGYQDLADDILAEVEEQVWKKAHTLKDKSRIQVWATQIAKHIVYRKCAEMAQYHSRFVSLEIITSTDGESCQHSFASHDPSPATDLEYKELKEAILRTLKLPNFYTPTEYPVARILIKGAILDQKTYQECCQEIDDYLRAKYPEEDVSGYRRIIIFRITKKVIFYLIQHGYIDPTE